MSTNLDPVIHPYARPSLKRMHLTAEERAVINRQAVEIFTRASNGGLSFQDSLAAVLLSGITWGAQS